MQAGLANFIAAAGEVFERDFMGASQVIVQRVGHSRAQHVFTVNGRTIARLRWRGSRRAVYEADGAKWDIIVGALDKRVSVIAEDGGESFLVERSRANPNKRRAACRDGQGKLLPEAILRQPLSLRSVVRGPQRVLLLQAACVSFQHAAPDTDDRAGGDQPRDEVGSAICASLARVERLPHNP